MNLARVRHASLQELRTRGLQQAHKLIDRVAPRLGTGRIGQSWVSSRPSDAAAALDRFLDSAPRRFFAGSVTPAATTVATSHFPDLGREILEAAAEIQRGRFDLLGYRGLDFGTLLTGTMSRSAIGAHRWLIGVVWIRSTPRVVGDSKVVWELNRHQWMLTLGQAYQLTGRPVVRRDGASRISMTGSSRTRTASASTGRAALKSRFASSHGAGRIMLLRRSRGADALAFPSDPGVHSRARVARRAVPVALFFAQYASDRAKRSAFSMRACSSPPVRTRLAGAISAARFCLQELERQVGPPTGPTSSWRRATTATRSRSISTCCCLPSRIGSLFPTRSSMPLSGWPNGCSPSAIPIARCRPSVTRTVDGSCRSAARARRLSRRVRAGGRPVQSAGFRVGGRRARARTRLVARRRPPCGV